MEIDILNSKFSILKLNSRFKNIVKQIKKTEFNIQSLLFNKKKFNLNSAKKWALEKGYDVSNCDVTGNFIHLTQSKHKFKDYRTVKISDDVLARVAGNLTSRFVGSLSLKNISKFSNDIKSELDLKLPLKVEMRVCCEGENRDGILSQEDLEASLEFWSNLPIIDWHDMDDMTHPTKHKLSDRKGYLGDNPHIEKVAGKSWIINDAYITDRYIAYLIYLAEKRNKPYEVSPEYNFASYWVDGEEHQTNINPHLITIVDKGHLEGNKMAIKA